MSKKYFLFVMLIFAGYSYSVSNPYSGGKVYLAVVDGEVCSYIDSNKDVDNEFQILLWQQDNKGKTDIVYKYENNFKKYYPTKKNCFILKNIIKNQPYEITLEIQTKKTKNGDRNIGFRNNFCFDGTYLYDVQYTDGKKTCPNGYWDLKDKTNIFHKFFN